MTLTKFQIKSGSQCQWLTFPARLVVNCLRRMILAWVTDPTAAESEARTGTAFLPNGGNHSRGGLTRARAGGRGYEHLPNHIHRIEAVAHSLAFRMAHEAIAVLKILDHAVSNAERGGPEADLWRK